MNCYGVTSCGRNGTLLFLEEFYFSLWFVLCIGLTNVINLQCRYVIFLRYFKSFQIKFCLHRYVTSMAYVNCVLMKVNLVDAIRVSEYHFFIPKSRHTCQNYYFFHRIHSFRSYLLNDALGDWWHSPDGWKLVFDRRPSLRASNLHRAHTCGARERPIGI